MAYKAQNGDIIRNLQEQVLKNKEDIYNYHNLEQVLADWGIKVLGQLDTWVEPTGSFEYGDAYAVGTEPPYDYYIYTRDGNNSGYWFNNGPISIVGPAGPQGPKGDSIVGPSGSQIYFGSNFPTGELRENDVFINTNYDLFTYTNSQWNIRGNIQGIPGENGIYVEDAYISNTDLIIVFSNGKTLNVGRVVGENGAPGQDGKSLATDIIGTVDSEEELATSFPVEEQESNAGVLVKIEGFENEYNLYIIIDDMWTNTGRYGGGSTVYSNGQYQQVFNSDTKLDKVSTSGDWRVYSITNTGAQSTQGFGSTQLDAGIIVSRREGGHILVPEAPASADTENKNNHAVSFSYLTSAVNAIKPRSMFWASSSTVGKSVTLEMPTGFSSFTTGSQFALPVLLTYVPSGGNIVTINRSQLLLNKNTKQWSVYDLEVSSTTPVFTGSLSALTVSSSKITITSMAPASGHASFIIEFPYFGAMTS